MADFTPKRVAEVETFSVDYTALLGTGETITSAVWSNSVKAGADANPGAMISGFAGIDGAVVNQKIQGGIAGVYYWPICTATTSANQIIVLPEPNDGALLVVA
jgi:hypothetical protein